MAEWECEWFDEEFLILEAFPLADFPPPPGEGVAFLINECFWALDMTDEITLLV